MLRLFRCFFDIFGLFQSVVTAQWIKCPSEALLALLAPKLSTVHTVHANAECIIHNSILFVGRAIRNKKLKIIISIINHRSSISECAKNFMSRATMLTPWVSTFLALVKASTCINHCVQAANGEGVMCGRVE